MAHSFFQTMSKGRFLSLKIHLFEIKLVPSLRRQSSMSNHSLEESHFHRKIHTNPSTTSLQYFQKLPLINLLWRQRVDQLESGPMHSWLVGAVVRNQSIVVSYTMSLLRLNDSKS
jgi:hypothetical protein